MAVKLLGLSIELPKLQLVLRAGYLASQHSYGKAGRDLEVHYGQPVERTSVRRMALEVEKHLMLQGDSAPTRLPSYSAAAAASTNPGAQAA